MKSLAQRNRWTEARLALGRVGASMPTAAVLDFSMDHARARDAVHAALHVEALAHTLQAAAFSVLQVESRAATRAEYLRRPDLGRLLSPAGAALLHVQAPLPGKRLTVVVADGLSAQAPAENALAVLEPLRAGLAVDTPSYTLDSIVIATQARVALGDAIGELRGAEAVIVLIGERPGLRSFDSLGAYLTYRPRPGRSDAERNCISNIRAAGLKPGEAATQLLRLLDGARALGQSGVALKGIAANETERPALGRMSGA